MVEIIDNQLTVNNASQWFTKHYPAFSLTQYSAQRIIDDYPLSNMQNPHYWQKRQGAFAEIWVDEERSEVFLVRDHFGCEPLYYYLGQQQFIFASNLPDILKQLTRSPELNMEQVIALLSFNQRYSDATFHQRIYRVEPGSMVHINARGDIKKQLFWQLDPQGADIVLSNEQAFLERFSELLHEAIAVNSVSEVDNLAGELSGGIDSSSILTAAHQQGIHYPLFMHVANENSQRPDDSHLARLLLQQLGGRQVTFVNADHFDPIYEFQYCAKIFAGAAPYLFFMFAQNVNRTIAASGRRIIFSGAGGDECVSSHAFDHTYLPHVIRTQGYLAAWRELSTDTQKSQSFSRLRRAEKLLKFSHPHAYYFLRQYISVKKLVILWSKQCETLCKLSKPHYTSVRHWEWDHLQGPGSHPLRLRIEYSAVLAKTLGFTYRYPLLYPKLVEFCFSLPVTMKRRDRVGRYLIRKYLASMQVPEEVYQKQQKAGGIIPGTMDKCMKLLASGGFDKHFVALPFMNYADQSSAHRELITKVHAYMLGCYLR